MMIIDGAFLMGVAAVIGAVGSLARALRDGSGAMRGRQSEARVVHRSGNERPACTCFQREQK